MNLWPLAEAVLVAALVAGSVAYVVRAAWRAVRRLSRPPSDRTGGAGCDTCGACPPARRPRRTSDTAAPAPPDP
jgi:hypothetical protein